jgi:hypothetical protein
VTAVLDTTLNMSGIAGKVDPSRVGLLGFSFGGYLGGKACSYLGDRLRWVGWRVGGRAGGFMGAGAPCGQPSSVLPPQPLL